MGSLPSTSDYSVADLFNRICRVSLAYQMLYRSDSAQPTATRSNYMTSAASLRKII